MQKRLLILHHLPSFLTNLPTLTSAKDRAPADERTNERQTAKGDWRRPPLLPRYKKVIILSNEHEGRDRCVLKYFLYTLINFLSFTSVIYVMKGLVYPESFTFLEYINVLVETIDREARVSADTPERGSPDTVSCYLQK